MSFYKKRAVVIEDAKSIVLDLKMMLAILFKSKKVLFAVIFFLANIFFNKEIEVVILIYQSDIAFISCWLVSNVLPEFHFLFNYNEVKIILNDTTVYLPISSMEPYIIGSYVLFLCSICIQKNICKSRFWKYLMVGVVILSLVRIVSFAIVIILFQKISKTPIQICTGMGMCASLINYYLLYILGKSYVKKLRPNKKRYYQYFY